jgi:hypothetical protein
MLQKRLEYPLVHDTILIDDLGMHQESTKFVPRHLTHDLLQRANDENIFNNVIISDEKWVYGYDGETKQ